MKTLIILRGLSKSEKESWLKKERLFNFLVDIDSFKKLYYKPEFKGGRDFLVRSLDDLVYRRTIEVLVSRMNGSLVVLDWGLDSTIAIEQLARVLGYTVFYKLFQVPKDYLCDLKKYQDPRYIPKSKDQLQEIVDKFNEQDYSDKNIINSYKDIDKYWDKSTPVFKIRGKSGVLHISDLHSHWSILKNKLMPQINKNYLTIFLGDYIDGLEEGGSRLSMEYVLRETRDNIIFLEGNHEARLRKYLGWKALKSQKKIISETLYNDIPKDFLDQTAKEFDDIGVAECWQWIDNINNKLTESLLYERLDNKFICSHCGLKWIEQMNPKYIGSLVNTGKHIEKTDEFFSKKYSEKNFWSIHGHCHYSNLNFSMYPNVFNLDPPDEKKVVVMEGKSNLNFYIKVLK